MNAKPALLFDFPPDVRGPIAAVLEACGFEPTWVDRVSDFREELVRLQPFLLIIQCGAARRDGVTLVERLQTHPQRPSFTLIASAKLPLDEQTNEVLLAGAHEILPMPLDPELLRIRLMAMEARKDRARTTTAVDFFDREALDSFPLRYAALDRAGRIAHVNSNWLHAAQAGGMISPEGSFVGVNYIDLCRRATGLDANVAHEAAGGIQAVLDGRREAFDLEYPCHLPSQEKFFLLRAVPLRRPSGGAIVAHIDITDRVKAEKALRRNEERLAQAQKMEALGRLAGGIAHDVNNMLTAVSTYSELLEERLKGDEESDMIREIQNTVTRSASLTRQLLMFGRPHNLSPEAVNVNGAINDIQRMLRRLIGSHIELETRMAPTVPPIFVDRGQLDHILLNLVINARDAMPKGGKMALVTESLSPGESSGARLPSVRIRVIDNGEGMDDKTRSRLFEPFFTTKPRGKGTGLGLFTVLSMVKQMRGHLDIESEPGKGTTCTVIVPAMLEDESVLTAEEDVAPASEELCGSESILLVDDDDAVRSAVAARLTACGYFVRSARNAADALILCDNSTDTVDMLVTEAVLPKVSGFQLARDVAERRPNVRVLLMSGYADEMLASLGGVEVGQRFLRKPFKPKELLGAIRELVDA